MNKSMNLSAEVLQELCKFWQDTLRLADWDVKVRIVRGNGLDLEPGVQGHCRWVLKRKEAVIRVLDPVDWDKDFAWQQDMEATLVHELLHLHFAPFAAQDDTAIDIAQEQALHALSYAFVNLRRR